MPSSRPGVLLGLPRWKRSGRDSAAMMALRSRLMSKRLSSRADAPSAATKTSFMSSASAIGDRAGGSGDEIPDAAPPDLAPRAPADDDAPG
eukprot:13878836-Alexandrium_andersonii.AAC.1